MTTLADFQKTQAEMVAKAMARKRQGGNAAQGSRPTDAREHETIISDVAVKKGLYLTVPVALFQLTEVNRLRPIDVATYCALYHHMTRRKGWRVEDGMQSGLSGAKVGVERLKRMLGLGDRNAVFASLARLEAANVITRTRRSQKVNAFTIEPVAKWDRTRPAHRAKRTTPRSAPVPSFGGARGAANGSTYVVDEHGKGNAEDFF